MTAPQQRPLPVSPSPRREPGWCAKAPLGQGHMATRHNSLQEGNPGAGQPPITSHGPGVRSVTVAPARRAGTRQAVSPPTRLMERR